MNALLIPKRPASMVLDVEGQIQAILRQWNEGAPPDTLAALEEYPNLKDDKSAVVDLAFAEYRRRCEAGEALDSGEFCENFPLYRSSLRQLFADNAWLCEYQHKVPKVTVPVVWPE